MVSVSQTENEDFTLGDVVNPAKNLCTQSFWPETRACPREIDRKLPGGSTTHEGLCQLGVCRVRTNACYPP
eukprot:11164786-Lingulodinium_polyedra.AAC.1